MPAPPPNGVSSTCPQFSGVDARKSTASTACPSASAFSTWRWVRNHSNHCGNSVKTSAFTEEPEVDVDPTRREVDRADAVARPAARAARTRRRDPPRAPRRDGSALMRRTKPTGTSPSTTAQAVEVGRPELVLARAWNSARGMRQLVPRRASSSSRDVEPSRRRMGFSAVPERAARSGAPKRRRRSPEAPARRRSRRTSRRVRAGGRRGRRPGLIDDVDEDARLSLTAAALTTVRSAWAVRPPRPMTCP